jgi:chemotaxis response regulator CheB
LLNPAPDFEIGAATRNLQAKSKPEDHLSVVCFGASAGGLVFAQKFQTASQPDMPQSAVKTGCVDQLLSPADIAVELGRIGKERALVKNGKVGSLTTGRAG